MNLQAKINKINADIKIELTKDELAPHLEAALDKKIASIEVDGFRKGKMPKSMFLAKYTISAVYPDAIDEVLNAVYPTLVMENKLNVIAAPEFNWETLKIDENEGFFVEGTVDLLPEFEVTGYKEAKDNFEMEKVKVTKKDVENEIKKLVEHKATIEVKEGAAEDGDIVVIDFEGFVDGEAFEGGKGENYPLTLGSNSFIPGFEEQLVGTKEGDQVDVVVTFPEEYHAENLKGKEATFKCTVHEVKTKKAVRLTKEVISDIKQYEATNKDELLEAVEKDMTAKREESAKNAYQNQVITSLIESAEIEAPASMIKQETDFTIENFKKQVSSQGIEFDMYLQMMGATEDALRTDIDRESKRKIEEMLLMDAIVKAENLEISDDEVSAKVKELAEGANMSEEEVIKALGETDRLKRDMAFDKAYKLVLGE